ncbi:MAG: tyrosine-type recombinase/integrase [Bryobacteraceae bacterium]
MPNNSESDNGPTGLLRRWHPQSQHPGPATTVHRMNPGELIRPATDPWDQLKARVLDSVTSPHSKRAYAKALEDFRLWAVRTGAGGFSRAAVQAYRAWLEASGLAPSTINVRLSALRKLAGEAAENGLLAAEVASAVSRVKGVKRLGVRAGNWLTRDQAQQLLALPDPSTPKGKRDRALLALLIGAGLRREELAALRIEEIQQRDGRWCVVDLQGKGSRVRTVPIPAWAKAAVDAWLEVAGFRSGPLLGPVNKSGRLTAQGISAQAIYDAVESYRARLGTSIAPHDLRRTFAKLAHKGHAPLEQIQLSLGHASIQTTERYLGVEQNLTDAPCDYLGLRTPGKE